MNIAGSCRPCHLRSKWPFEKGSLKDAGKDRPLFSVHVQGRHSACTTYAPIVIIINIIIIIIIIKPHLDVISVSVRDEFFEWRREAFNLVHAEEMEAHAEMRALARTVPIAHGRRELPGARGVRLVIVHRAEENHRRHGPFVRGR